MQHPRLYLFGSALLALLMLLNACSDEALAAIDGSPQASQDGLAQGSPAGTARAASDHDATIYDETEIDSTNPIAPDDIVAATVQHHRLIQGISLTGSVAENVQATSVTGTIGESGRITIDQSQRVRWTKVTLARRYQNPVVFLGPISHNGSAPAMLRLRKIKPQSFLVRLEEWQGNHRHNPEEIGFWVLEQGTHQFDGLTLEVGTLMTNQQHFTPHSLRHSFSITPIVLTEVQSRNGRDEITTRLRNITPQGFEVRVQEKENARNAGRHKDERIGYIAITPGAGSNIQAVLEPSATLTEAWHSVTFPEAIRSANPALLAAMQSFNGSDTATLRYRNLSQTGVHLKVSEERSKDQEVSHTPESFAYVVLEGEVDDPNPATFNLDAGNIRTNEGEFGESTLQITREGGFDGRITLSAVGAEDVEVLILPPQLGPEDDGRATLRIRGYKPGNVTLTIIAESQGQRHERQVSVTINDSSPFSAELWSAPPQVLSATLRCDSNNGAVTQALLRVQYERDDEHLPESIVLRTGSTTSTLRRSSASTYEGMIPISLAALEAYNARFDPPIAHEATEDAIITQMLTTSRGNAPAPRFSGRTQSTRSPFATLQQDTQLLPELRTDPVRFDVEGCRIGQTIAMPLLAGVPEEIEQTRSLTITDLSVVEDRTRTFDACTQQGNPTGPWTFGHLMRELARSTGQDPSLFVRHWIESWTQDHIINGDEVPSREQIIAKIIRPWEQASGVPEGGPLDPNQAPFRLLAIINRFDLRNTSAYGAVDAGEARFIFSAVDMVSCVPLQFNVIFEYLVPTQSCGASKAWAQRWVDLAQTPNANALLEGLTREFTDANKRVVLGQLRTNEIDIGDDIWELREFHISAASGLLEPAPIAQTPADSFNGSTELHRYVLENLREILLERYRIPRQFGNQPFLSGATRYLATDFWTTRPPLAPPSNTTDTLPFGGNGVPDQMDARHIVSVNTCNGCHAIETNTLFTQVFPRFSGQEAFLSEFLTGAEVSDPLDPRFGRTFNDLKRRAQDLDRFVTTGCGDATVAGEPPVAGLPPFDLVFPPLSSTFEH